MYDDDMTIAEVLADTLAAKKLTQSAAADQLGVKQPVVSRWVSGKDAPSDEHVGRIAKFTGLTRAQVLQAVHLQRVTRTNLPARVGSLEKEVAGLRSQLDAAVRLLEQLSPPEA